MNPRLILVVAVALVSSQVNAQEKAGKRGELKSVRDRASYSFGMMIGGNLKKQQVDVDYDLLMQGFRDATSSGKTVLTEQQAGEAIQAFEKDVAAKQAEESKNFLVQNKRKPGVKSTASGLQYKVLKPGKGAKPKATDVVSVNYHASFINGTEFESNGPKPFSTQVDMVIPGWQEALQLMDVGSKWQLFVPPELGYGEEGSPPAIGPGTTLVFELELLGIEKPGAKAAARENLPGRVQ
jgi:FKBP-type peptidyl-prolyl cis-trans isomerase